MKKATAVAIASLTSLLVMSCEIQEVAEPKLNAANMQFSMNTVQVTELDVPAGDNLSQISEAELRRSKINLRVLLNAHNPTAKPASFDGAKLYLRVEDTTEAAEPITTVIQSVDIAPGATESLAIDFPFSLNNMLLSPIVILKVLRGDEIAYKLNAELQIRLEERNQAGEVIKDHGTGTFHLDLAADEVEPSSDFAGVERFAKLFGL